MRSRCTSIRAPIRATGVGTAVSFGRIGAVISGYVGAWALEYRGALSFFAVDRGRDGGLLRSRWPRSAATCRAPGVDGERGRVK